VDPEAVARLPLLAAVTQVPLPDNELTRTFDPKLRKASLEALLLDCLRHRARREPLFLLIEDGHWMDALSRELLEAVARVIAGLPVFILLTSRPPDTPAPTHEALASLPCFTEVRLARLEAAEARQLIALKLRRLFGERSIAPAVLVERLVARADGNPFYIEELLDYLNERGLKLDQPATWEQLELPSSLQSLILTRIDQLTENQKAALKVASVIGRLFRAAMIWGAHPELGDPARVQGDLEALRRLELTALDAPEPKLVYLFKHVVTQEVAYESLPFATRARLHAQIGRYLEAVFAGELAQQLDLLAFHYGRSGDEAKARQYLRQAGEAAQGQYANAAAIDYYRRLLPLVAGGEKVDVLLHLGQVLERVGNWSEVAGLYGEGLAISQSAGDRQRAAQGRHALGDLMRKQGRYAEAGRWFAEAQRDFAELADEGGEAQVLHGVGTLAAAQGDYARARQSYEASLAIRTRQHDRPRLASLLSNLGILFQFTGDFLQARVLHEEALRLRRELADRWAIANSLNNLALVLRDLGDHAGARTLLEESVALNRQVGDRWATANALNSLADVAADQQDFATALTSLEASLAVNRELGDRRAIAFLLESFARVGALRGQAACALRLAAAAAALRESIGAPLSPAETAQQNRWLEAAGAGLPAESRAALRAEGRAFDLDAAVAHALSQVGAGPAVSPPRP
jgi:predicted ATPase